MANPVFEAVRTVLAIREYQDRDVPAEVARHVAESGYLSASAGNRQPWHFVVVRDRATLKLLGSLIRTGPYVAGCAFAIVVAYERDTVLAVSDASRAAQSMILTAWGDGVGSNWTGFGGLSEVATELGIPDRYDVLAVLPFGYPARPVGKGRKKRKPFGEVVSAERFGQPFN